MSNDRQQVRPFGWRDKVGYLIGNIANDFTFVFAGLFLQVFYTDVIGIPAFLVGTMFLIARALDAVTDTVMGAVLDRVPRGKNGKFRPWLLYACGPVALASFLMYQSSLAAAPQTVKIVYMFITYLFWGSICYTAVNIPYGSMASVMSPEADDRSALSTFRGLGSIIPQVVMGVILPMVLYTSTDDGQRIVNAPAFPKVALILSVFAVIGYIVCYLMCTERVQSTQKREKTSFRKGLKTLFTDRALIAICLVFVFFLAAQMLNQTINNYLFKDYFGDTTGLTVLGAIGFLPILLLSPFSVPIARRFGKREIGIVASLLGSVSFFLLFFLHTHDMWLYIIINVMGMLGFGLFNLIIWAFISDVIDDNELRTGTREDGMIYAICSFSRKLGQAVASTFGGWSLSWIGYQEGSLVGQTQAVKDGIYRISTLTPAILYFSVALLLAFFYPLTKKRVRENIAALKAKNAEQE